MRGECYISRSQSEMSLECPESSCLVWPEQRCLVWPERTCLIWPETVMSCMAGDSDVLYARNDCGL